MKILLTTNKTYRGVLDGNYWYTYLPLQQLGHDVEWYDTTAPAEPDFNKVVENFKPDLIWCCLCGDPNTAPYEPWKEIEKETISGRTKTFNWFCDDTWRFEKFSKEVCNFFSICSTPEPLWVEKYISLGYSNIIVGNWHANIDLYPKIDYSEKNIPLSFIGAPTPSRVEFLSSMKTPGTWYSSLSQEKMYEAHAKSLIGLNLSVNDNDPTKATQMKQRMFEIVAGQTLLLTQYHEGIEEFFELDKEIITFKTVEELDEKASALLRHPQLIQQIATRGHERFLKEHESKIRLKKIIKQIGSF